MRDERQLVERASRGDAVAIDELLAAHLPQLRAFVRLRSGPTIRAKESVSDLVQSTCREVLQGLDRFEWAGEASFRAWLYTTAQRKIADRAEHWQAQKREAGREVALAGSRSEAGGDARLAEVVRSVASPSQEAAGLETLERIERAFERLSEAEREIITLARIAGLSHAQIAERLGTSEGAARVRLFRALARLSEELSEPDSGPSNAGPG